jgi:deoxyribonuclease II
MTVIMLLLLICVSLSNYIADAALTCLADNGTPTDRWTGIKANNDHHMYYYRANNQSFTRSPWGVDQTLNGAIMMTLQPLYDNVANKSIAYVMWNDDPPGPAKASSSYAHSKGILATDGTSGFWLTHSMPNWPDIPNFDDINPGIFPSDKYAQSMGCVSISIDTVNDIANTLRIDYPFVYSSYVPDAIKSKLNYMTDLIDRNKVTNETAANTFYTLDNVKYTQFAKSKNWGEDLWDDLVSPYYKAPMYVETWISGSGGPMSSMCYNGTDNPAWFKKNELYDIYQVSYITMPDGENWKNTQDHSKWGATIKSQIRNDDVYTATAACVGDINRMCSQEKRGGGAMCVEDAGLNKAFIDIVSNIESCYFKDPCSTTSPCYWCNNPDLTYPPTNSPTISPTLPAPAPAPVDGSGSANTNSAMKALGITSTRVFFGVIVGSAFGLIILIFIIQKCSKLKKKKLFTNADTHNGLTDKLDPNSGSSSNGSLPRRASFEVDATSTMQSNPMFWSEK